FSPNLTIFSHRLKCFRVYKGRLNIPGESPVNWVNIFTNEIIAGENMIKISEICKAFPLGLLVGAQ
ncbi:MAG: hypothetical protein KKG06_10025, partial [Bacteroidetes bacterium]|nr:hypothetical protein [Bacteroidota bacterium]MBU1423496.1 hypothetical protein [Bacteroidota bacterium]